MENKNFTKDVDKEKDSSEENTKDTDLEDSVILRFITDARSGKIKELIENNFAEVCWWFGGTSEQYRISGTCEIVAAPGKEKKKRDFHFRDGEAGWVGWAFSHPIF